MKTRNIHKIASLLFSVLVLCFAIAFYALSWEEPTEAPPGGNVDVPVNIGTDQQYKGGGLGIGGPFWAYTISVMGENGEDPNLASPRLRIYSNTGGGVDKTIYMTADDALGSGLNNSPSIKFLDNLDNLKGVLGLAGENNFFGFRSAQGDIVLANAGGGNLIFSPAKVVGAEPAGDETVLRLRAGHSQDVGDEVRVDWVDSDGDVLDRIASNPTAGGDFALDFYTTTNGGTSINRVMRMTHDRNIYWGNLNNRGILSVDQGSSLEIGGWGTPFIDISNDDDPPWVTDFDIRLILTNNDTLEVQGGDLCHQATGNCLSGAGGGGGAPTMLANNKDYTLGTFIAANTCSLIVIDAVLEGTRDRAAPKDIGGELILAFSLNGVPIAGQELKKYVGKFGDSGYSWIYGGTVSRRIYIEQTNINQNITATLTDTANLFLDATESGSYSVICY